jgi:electron transfer flavoprotein beta subunit
MDVTVCIKRVPAVGGKVVIDSAGQDVDTKFLGWTMSPHEECAVEEAVRITERHGGTSTVLTLGTADAEAQLRYAMSLGIDKGVLLETSAPDGTQPAETGPQGTARAIARWLAERVEAGAGPDLVLFGNEAPDTGDFQVGIRVAESLGLPCVTGVKELTLDGGVLVAKREHGAITEVFTVDLPAVCTVKEGLNLPRYPSLPGRLRAKSKPMERAEVARSDEALKKVGLRLPGGEGRSAESLGVGPPAATRVVEVLKALGVLTP